MNERRRYKVHRLSGAFEYRRIAVPSDLVLMLGGLVFFRVDFGEAVSEYVEARNPEQARLLFDSYKKARDHLGRLGTEPNSPVAARASNERVLMATAVDRERYVALADAVARGVLVLDGGK